MPPRTTARPIETVTPSLPPAPGRPIGRLLDRAAQPFGGRRASVSPVSGRTTRNSSPPIRASKIGPAQVGRQSARHLDQHRIAGGMAPGIVHRFEAVEVDHHHGEPVRRYRGPFRDPLDLRERVAAVVQSGQRVDHRQTQTRPAPWRASCRPGACAQQPAQPQRQARAAPHRPQPDRRPPDRRPSPPPPLSTPAASCRRRRGGWSALAAQVRHQPQAAAIRGQRRPRSHRHRVSAPRPRPLRPAPRLATGPRPGPKDARAVPCARAGPSPGGTSPAPPFPAARNPRRLGETDHAQRRAGSRQFGIPLARPQQVAQPRHQQGIVDRFGKHVIRPGPERQLA